MNFDLVYILILVEVPCVAQFYPMFVNNLSCLELESLKINSKGRTHEFCNIYQMEINNWKQIHVIVCLCFPNRLEASLDVSTATNCLCSLAHCFLFFLKVHYVVAKIKHNVKPKKCIGMNLINK